MTSQVNPNNIDGSYPVAGQDNDSQGFRDNFTNIRNNFTFIKSEVEDLQNKAILKSSLTNSTLNNDFAGNAISNATLTSWRETYNNVSNTASGTIAIDFTNGNFQKIGLAGAISSLSFTWPDNVIGYYASIKLWINVTNTAHTITFATAPTVGDPDSIAGYSAGVLTFNAAELANNNDYLFEIFTVDGGYTLGIKDLIRNRDIDLSGLQISGNLNLDNITATGNVITTNGVFWAGNGLPFSIAGGGAGSFSTITASSTIIGSGNIVAASTTTSLSTTTGALVVAGGAGIASNINVGGNLVTNGGRINTSTFLATVTTEQELVANVAYNTFIIDTASSATIANLWVTIPASAVNGTELVVSTLAPLTSCNVRAIGGTVKWVPTTFASAGNVSVKLVYSSTSNAWLRSA
jgi:hypothetical protein